jgi:mRNA-degrading endonuclease RelE of RelBE toxin-antitoxin system
LAYTLKFTPKGDYYFSLLTANHRATVFDQTEIHLTIEPTTVTRNRKLMRPNSIASWELRIGNLRVYYTVNEEEKTVYITAVGVKKGNQVFVGTKELDLTISPDEV